MALSFHPRNPWHADAVGQRQASQTSIVGPFQHSLAQKIPWKRRTTQVEAWIFHDFFH